MVGNGTCEVPRSSSGVIINQAIVDDFPGLDSPSLVLPDPVILPLDVESSITPSKSTSTPSRGRLEPTICTCRNGQITKNCLFTGINACDSCNSGYILTPYAFWPGTNIGYSTCKPKVCFCENGIAESEGNCLNEFKEVCVGCDEGYELEEGTNKCVPISCLCPNGTPTKTGETTLNSINKLCPNKSFSSCEKCDLYFHQVFYNSWDVGSENEPNFQQNICQLNICTCQNGQPNPKCAAHNSENCLYCDRSFDLLDFRNGSVGCGKCDSSGCISDREVDLGSFGSSSGESTSESTSMSDRSSLGWCILIFFASSLWTIVF